MIPAGPSSACARRMRPQLSKSLGCARGRALVLVPASCACMLVCCAIHLFAIFTLPFHMHQQCLCARGQVLLRAQRVATTGKNRPTFIPACCIDIPRPAHDVGISNAFAHPCHSHAHALSGPHSRRVYAVRASSPSPWPWPVRGRDRACTGHYNWCLRLLRVACD